MVSIAQSMNRLRLPVFQTENKGINMKKLLTAILMGVATMTTTVEAKTLIAYFSATGTTAQVAEKLAKATDADLFKIEPEQPYTDADLNWHDSQSRSSVEMNDASSRPTIANKVENMAQYDTVFVGFPIWWGRQPSIVDTFMESYDFSGKKVIPFATSGSSGIGDSCKIIQGLVPNAKVDAGKRFSGSVSEEALADWAKQFTTK